MPTDRPSPAESTSLLDAVAGLEVSATIRPIRSAADLEWVEDAWRAARAAAVDSIEAAGGHVEHGHWDWARKGPWIESGHLEGFILEASGDPQGVLVYRPEGVAARLAEHAGRLLLYVEFVEVAPWNTRSLVTSVRYKPVGVALLRQVIQISRRRGLDGRVGLHALPQAESFYARSQMTPMGPDEAYGGLVYFEFTADNASQFVARQLRPI